MQGEVDAYIMAGERFSIGEIIMVEGSAVSPGITCENEAGNDWVGGIGRGKKITTRDVNGFAEPGQTL
jgi:hypothetical protein